MSVTMPHSSACSKLTVLPVTISSIARDLPTKRASRCVPPVPGSTPSATSGKPDLAGILARDADVGRHRDLQAAADAVAVERGDHELRRLLEPLERLVGVQAEHVLELGRNLVEHADVRAGREELLALAGEHDDLDVLIEPRIQDRVVELAHHLVRVRVGRRIVHLDEADVAVLPVVDDALAVERALLRARMESASRR